MPPLLQGADTAMRAPTGTLCKRVLFTDEATLAASNPLDVVWMSGKGELVRLTD